MVREKQNKLVEFGLSPIFYRQKIQHFDLTDFNEYKKLIKSCLRVKIALVQESEIRFKMEKYLR